MHTRPGVCSIPRKHMSFTGSRIVKIVDNSEILSEMIEIIMFLHVPRWPLPHLLNIILFRTSRGSISIWEFHTYQFQ